MPFPIKPNYSFKVNHKLKDNCFSMRSADVYRDSYGVGYVISGERMIITPGKTVIVSPGTIQFMHKDLIHRTTYISSGIYENIGIKFTEKVAEHIISIIGQAEFEQLYSQISFSLTEAAQQKILQLFTMMEEEYNQYKKYSDSIMECLIIQIFIETLRGKSPVSFSNIESSTNRSTLLEALHYIEQFYAEDPSLKQTAAAIHVSDAYLSRLFSNELGTSYSSFLTELKLNHAMKLLSGTTLPITEIAVQSGFQNNNYFSGIFKKKIGISPLKYRKSIKCNQ
ncbi:MAG: helix-turn-helix transcriptional regulator [Lachnospiraceae bacterium]|nr:helix-turn-helix transcriptional regulator [Lachnospiraceae bacterium]